jgi:S-DNA-T family DNA segregation ATPase FtsK/SpoIIIE
LEVARPRLPWWALLPWWLLLITVPIGTAILLVRLGLRLAHRYPIAVLVPVAVLLVVRHWGWWSLLLVLLTLLAGLVIWTGLDRDTCRRFVWFPVLSEWRRATVYAFRWRTVMRLADLVKRDQGREYRPRLRSVRSEGWRDRVRVRMIPAQSPEAWEIRRDNLAHSFGARSCRVRVLRPRVVELDLIHRDPLIRPLPVPVLADDVNGVDLKKVIVGRTETGKPWRLRLLGSQLLVVGVPGAGKGSVLWSIVWQLARLFVRAWCAWWASTRRAAWSWASARKPSTDWSSATARTRSNCWSSLPLKSRNGPLDTGASGGSGLGRPANRSRC